jgi:hypothetical protein
MKGEHLLSNAYAAHKEWASRPADERFQSLTSMLDAARERWDRSQTSHIQSRDLSVKATEDGTLYVNGRTRSATLTNWSFSQLAQLGGAPASYVQTLPATLAASCLNTGLARAYAEDGATSRNLLFSRGEGDALTLRSLNSTRYARVWDRDLIDRLIPLTEQGWRLPLAYKGGVFGADEMEPAGAYMGDRDMFVFLVNEDRRVMDPTDPSGEGMGRGVILRNSEVGAAALTLELFLYRYVCGNHIIWGQQQITTMRRRHVGQGLFEQWGDTLTAVRDYSDSSAQHDEAFVRKAATLQLGTGKDEVVDLLTPILTKGLADRAYVTAEAHNDNPRTPWGIAQGLTRLSQEQTHQDRRFVLDQQASSVLKKFVAV